MADTAAAAAGSGARATTEQHIFRVFDADASGTIDFDELAETWRALSGKELDAEALSALGAEPGASLTFGQFQRLLREQLPHVVDLLATVNSDLVAKGKRGLNKREIAELLSRVGPSLVSILETGHPAMPRAPASPKGTFCASDLDEVTARASSEFHVEIHSLASQLASAHRDAEQQWTDEEVEILWLSHDAMERERDAAMEECARARAHLAEVTAERDALAKLASLTRTVKRAAATSGKGSAARPRQQTFGLSKLVHETHDAAQGEHENQLPERGYLDQLYLDELESCDADVMREMVEECGVVDIVPEQVMQASPDGLRDILYAYVSGRPAATSTTVCGYLWRKDEDDNGSTNWRLFWAVLDCASEREGGVDTVFKLCNSKEHAAIIRQANQPPEKTRVSTAATPVAVINLSECVEVRRSTAHLAKAGEFELVTSSATHHLCAVTRGDSRVWARVLDAAMRPNFGSAQEQFTRALRKQLTVTQFVARLLSARPSQSAATEQAHRRVQPTTNRSSTTGPPAPPQPPPPPPPPPPPLPEKLESHQEAQPQSSNSRSASTGALPALGSVPTTVDRGVERASSVPNLGGTDDSWRHVCDCPREISDCELCKSHFGPPRAPDFKATVPDGCDFLESIRYSQRRKAAQQAWPWAPYDEMECYANAKGADSQAQSKSVPLHPPWHPFSPPFTAQPVAGSTLLEGLQFKQAQEKAAITYSMAARRHTTNGHDGSLEDCGCWAGKPRGGNDSDSDDEDGAKSTARHLIDDCLGELRRESNSDGAGDGWSDDGWSDDGWSDDDS